LAFLTIACSSLSGSETPVLEGVIDEGTESTQGLTSGIDQIPQYQVSPKPAPKEINFAHISVDQGLSQSSVLSILQDSKGLLWFGTEDGLNKYDGYNFTIFKHDP